MANWIYNPADYSENSFTPIPEGDHRARIQDVVFKHFNSGNKGYEITLEVSGYNSRLWYYLVLSDSDPKKTNQKIGSFFDAFGIQDYNMDNYAGWKGKVGAVRVKHEDYKGEKQAKVHYCIEKKKQDKLPPWKEAGTATPVFASPTIDDSDLPFA